MNLRSSLRVIKILGVSATAFSLDRITKYLAYIYLRDTQPLILIKPFLYLQYVENKGFLFGIGSEVPLGFTISATALGIFGLILLLKYINTIWMNILIGGGISNLFDRIVTGKVIDFIDIGISDNLRWPTFNLADCFVFAGLIWLLLSVRRLSRRK